MDDPTISRIVQAAAALAPEDQPFYIARQAIAAARAADAGITDQAIESEFRLLYRNLFGSFPSGHAVELGVAWARHLLNRGRHG